MESSVHPVEPRITKSAHCFRAIFAQSPLGISVRDARTGIIRDANPRFAEICGRELVDVVGRDWVELTHPDDVEADLERSQPGAGEVLPFRLPKRYMKPDGTTVWVETSVTPLGFDEDGEPLHLCVIDDITERRDSEAKLTQLVEILESSPDYVATTDLNGVILWSNAACRSLTGVAAVEDYAVERRSLFKLLAPASRTRFLEEAVPALWSEGSWRGEIEGLLPDGSTFPLSFVAIAHFGADGYPELFSGVARDITETKLAEASLAASERRMRTLVDAAPIGIFETNAWGACTYVNPAFCAVTRIADPSDAMGLGWGRVLHPEDAQAVGSQWAIAIKTDQPFVGQFRFLTPAGDVVWADIEAVPVRDEDGRTQMFLGTVDDITERLELERAQFEASELFRTAFDNAPMGILLTDVSTTEPRVGKCNQRYADMLGRSREELMGMSVVDLTHPDDLQAALDARQQLVDGVIDHHSMELRYLHSNGHWIWVSLTRSVVRDQQGRPKFTVAQTADITEVRAIREEIERHAFTDVLTGLPNRRSFTDRLEREFARCRDGDARVAVIFIDLDRFKLINDRMGHDAGDRLLVEVGRELTYAVRPEDVVARLGGDEFAIIVADVDDTEIRTVADRLVHVLHFPRTLPNGEIVTVTASIGLAWAAPGETMDALMRRADQLMYDAKHAGRNQAVIEASARR